MLKKKNRADKTLISSFFFKLHWHLKCYWVQYICWYFERSKQSGDVNWWQSLWKQFALVLSRRLENVFMTSLTAERRRHEQQNNHGALKQRQKELGSQSCSAFPHFYLDWLHREQRFTSTICEDFGCTHTTFAPCIPIISFFSSRRGCKWKLLICHAAAGGFLLVPVGVWENYPTLTQKHNFHFVRFPPSPICLYASLFQGVGDPKNIQSQSDLTTWTYKHHCGVTWIISPRTESLCLTLNRGFARKHDF